MKDLNKIADEISQQRLVTKERIATAEFVKNVVEHCKEFLTGLFNGLIKNLQSHKYDVNVVNQKDVQKVDGEVSVKELSSLLNKVSKTISDQKFPDNKDVIKAIKDIKFPNITIPKPLNSIEISNLKKLEDLISKLPEPKEKVEITNLNRLEFLLKELPSKIKLEPQTINIPPVPKTIDVGNLSGIETKLSELTNNDREPTGFYWDTDDLGNTTRMVVQYPDGEVIYDGFNVRRVSVDDRRHN